MEMYHSLPALDHTSHSNGCSCTTLQSIWKNLRHNAFGVTDEKINIVISDTLMPIPALN